MGQLAAASAAKLPALQRPVLLVAQPKEHRLQRLRDANLSTLTEGTKPMKRRRKSAHLSRSALVSARFPHSETTKRAEKRCTEADLTNRAPPSQLVQLVVVH